MKLVLNVIDCHQSFDVNTRLVYTMRSLGQGYIGVKKFTSLMNMLNPMTAINYDKIISNVTKIVKVVAHETMQDACNDIKNNNRNEENNVTDTVISVEGT